jgi:ABC-type multidrug transport system fused ATPase/permease subunit
MTDSEHTQAAQPVTLQPETVPESAASYSTYRAIKALAALARPQLLVFLGGFVALTIGSSVNLLLPELVRRILDPVRFERVTSHLLVIVLGLSFLFLLQGMAFFLRSYLFGIVGQRVYADLRERLFRGVLLKDIAFFDANRASDLAARINSDAALVQDAVSVKLSVIIRYGLQVVLGVVLMLCMSWKLTLAIVVSVMLLVGASVLFVTKLRAASRAYQDALAGFTSFASESFSGAKVVRALGAITQLTQRAVITNAQARVCGERRVFVGAGFSAGASALLNILLLVVAWYGVTLVIGGTLPLHELAAFVLYGAIVAVSFSFLLGAYSDLMQGLGGLERVLQLIDGERSVATLQRAVSLRGVREGARALSVSAGLRVVCQGIRFAYPGRSEQPALVDFSCVIDSGSFTAFVGPSGSGKSSFAQLVCRLYGPSAGTITCNEVDLSRLDESVVRAQIAWVPQEPTLFGFTVLENILLGNEELVRDEALKILSSWEFLDFVGTLASGFDTPLGEYGTLLSGGQRQRLAIARALLRRPALLVLDEATSGLDSETEEQVLGVIRRYLPQATLVVISHRLSTVKDADRIYVLNEGCIVEQGTHSELIRSAGLYRQYAERQSLGFRQRANDSTVGPSGT